MPLKQGSVKVIDPIAEYGGGHVAIRGEWPTQLFSKIAELPLLATSLNTTDRRVSMPGVAGIGSSSVWAGMLSLPRRQGQDKLRKESPTTRSSPGENNLARPAH